MDIIAIAKKFFPGVSWRNPLLNSLFRCLDPLDYLFRCYSNLKHIPRYSIRVRSNGVRGQFGGNTFNRYGQFLVATLAKYTGLNARTKVLEIGCGCGRAAIPLAEILQDNHYTGIDIEQSSLESLQNNARIRQKQFNIYLMDVQNDEYNPAGAVSAANYKFPFDDNSFDVIFLISVFTHMMPKDIGNYIKQISRTTRPGGHCLMSTFVIDHGRQSKNLSFDYEKDGYYFTNPTMPEIAMAYPQAFFIDAFKNCGMELTREVILGTWRESARLKPSVNFPQDMLIFRKPSMPGTANSNS